ncbi:conserved hypothetical protein [Leishmania mexicana MHOM/GT/2001/U1103]|uniref:Uncharacterized protein n=1 Tax=Leishmania mexicana (strain MHOM/GT/2001/U1103) TaxID=929439 RepID=E9AKT9_LEIMU|nr:conserved hypothetical protein [Leishmania mexicana MHOM/GT/2001/U1103]CBZ23541.1 conserved hypothetical protein [Leishmania mexicana MHOM/GT/2001/U1103]
MQEQYVRKACTTIASQIILVTAGDGTKHANTCTGSNSSSVVAAARAATTYLSATSAETKVATGLDDLQRACDAVVRHAMTLYRLCRRPGGGAIDIVSVGASSGSSGAGAASAAEEAAYCVCAAVMALEPNLWASLVRRAQLLRPRKPSFRFVAPVAVPPVLVKDVERFFGRSRHLMSSTAAPAVLTDGIPTSAAASSLACEGVRVPAPTVSASASPLAVTTTTTTTAATATATLGLPALQAEAVAACFFFKTMSAAERLRRSDVLEVRVRLPDASRAVGASAESNGLTTAAAGFASAAVGAPAVAERDGVVVSSSLRRLTGAVTAATAASAQELTAGPRKGGRRSGLRAIARGAAAPGDTGPSLHTRPTRSAASLLPSYLAAASMLFNDGLGGWGGQQVAGGTRTNPSPLSSTRRPDRADGAEDDAGVSDWPSGISSGSSSQSRDSSPGDGGIGAGKVQGRHPLTGKGNSAHDHQAADTAAVLTRLYALALSAEDPAADVPLNAETTTQGHQQQQQNGGGSDQHRVGDAVALSMGTHTLFSAAAPPSMLSSDSGLSLVALGASVTYACDALHWGRLQMLVRYPLLFRTIPTSAEASSTVALAGGGEALTVEAMVRMSGTLGMARTAAPVFSPASATPPDSTAGSRDATPPSAASLLAYMSSLYGSADSIVGPARLRTSSPPLLFPPPPSLITDGVLLTRLLICSAWLLVYADGLFGSDDNGASVAPTQSVTGGVWPRVRPTPAVQAIVAYCVAVVREAREMSAGVNAAARSAHGSLSGTVCCPVCDDLVKEKQPVLWWSTLRDDRASWRAQVRSLLENSNTNSDEAAIAAALTDHLACEGRGRRYATPLLSGSEGAPCRVTALQQRWGAYIMGADTSATDDRAAAATAVTPRGAEDASVRVDPVKADADLQTGGAAADARDTAGDSAKEAATPVDVLWTALTQRVAAATDFCVFLSAHPTEFAASHSTAAASVTSDRPKRPRAEDEEEAASRTHFRHRRQEKHHRGEHAVGSDDSDDGGWGDGNGTRADTAWRAGVALRGSRHAVEEAEEWGRLLCRCGWANAAPPSGTTSPRMYEAWASSLFSPSAIPTPQQAATLRRRLSRYSLEDFVRKLVLGRGGSWDRYARLLFGDDVRTDSTASPFCPPPAMDVGAAATKDVPAQPMAQPPASHSSLRPRAPSLSLLEEAAPDAEGVYVPHMHANPRATQISPLPRQLIAAAQSTPHRSSGPALSPPLSCDAAPANADADANHAVAAERWAATPVSKGKMPSIPLLVSPLMRQHQMGAVLGTAAAPPLPLPSPADAAARTTGVVPECAFGADATPARRKDASAKAPVSAPLEQLRAQQAALYDLLRFRPRLPPLREEDAVLECASCFSLFHQECIAPVQRNFMGQVFLCHTCRLRWARPYAAGCGLVHQAPEQHRDPEVAGDRCAADRP